MPLEGFTEYAKEDADRYNKYRWWPGLTWGDVFDKATDLYPRKEALVDDTSRLTYGELRALTDKLALSFINMGLKTGDFALIQIPNWYEFIPCFFALQKVGVVAVCLISRHGKAEIEYLCSLTKPTVWIVPEKYGKINYLPLIKDIQAANPQLDHIITVRGAREGRFTRMESLVERPAPTKTELRTLEERRPDPMEVSIIIPTGGTTGLPKAVPRTHNDFIANVEYHARAWDISCEDTILTVAPVSHGQGLLCGVGASFFNYARYVLTDSGNADDICRVMEREKVTALPTVPAMIQRIVGLPNLKDYDLSSLRKVYSGGAPSTPELVKSVYEKLGCKFVNAFGSAEGSCAMTRLDDDLETICNTVGLKDCPYTQFKIIDPNENELPPGKEGELATKGPTIFSGYFKSNDENKKTFTRDGFFKTGDLAKIDASGLTAITGRIKETILRGGETISAVGIERLIGSHSGVADVAVIGMPDKDLGERICAYIQTKPGVSVTFEEIISLLKSKGASVMQLPERIEFIESIPLTKIGKADKKLLKEDITKRLAAS